MQLIIKLKLIKFNVPLNKLFENNIINKVFKNLFELFD